MSKVRINTPEFESNLSSIETKISEIKSLMNDIDDEMEKVDGTHLTIWSGKAQEMLYNHYNKVSAKFPNMEKRLDEYVVFLKNTLDLYKQEEDTQEKSVETQDGFLDVV